MPAALQIAQLINALGRVDGRKKLQKLVHILQELGHPFREKFRYSFYGMYSQELRAELDSLEDDKLILEESLNTVGFGFTFSTTEKLASFLSELGKEDEADWVALAKYLNSHSGQQLEAISTILFLSRLGYEGEQLEERFLALKAHLHGLYSQSAQEAEKLKNQGVVA